MPEGGREGEGERERKRGKGSTKRKRDNAVETSKDKR